MVDLVADTPVPLMVAVLTASELLLVPMDSVAASIRSLPSELVETASVVREWFPILLTLIIILHRAMVVVNMEMVILSSEDLTPGSNRNSECIC